MPLELINLPCLTDNYAYLVRNTATNEVALIDAPEGGPIVSYLDAHGLTLSTILLTHHHWDHVDGVPDLVARYDPKIIGAAADEARLPKLDQSVVDGQEITICSEPCEVIDVYGHTIGHVAFYFPQSGYLFSADSLMAFGCGRLFEGTPAQMWVSMQRLRALPDDTLVCSGHEYTASNAKFMATIDPNTPAVQARIQSTAEARARNEATVPSLLSLEKATNPYLRADHPDLKAAVGMEGASDLEVFTEIRRRKDNF